jgi:hypothetical protein
MEAIVLPGGMMPITQLVAMLRTTPPQHAAGVLLAMPMDRINAVLGAMKPVDVARLLIGTKPPQRNTVLGLLSIEQIIGVLRTLPVEHAATLLAGLPKDHIVAVIDGLPPKAVPVLLEAMPPEFRAALLGEMDPYQADGTLTTMYQRGVAQALGRTNVHITYPNGDQDPTLLVQTFERLIVVSICYHDENGALSQREIRSAEDTATWLRAHGVLVVTNAPLTQEAIGYRSDARAMDRLVDVVTWIDNRHDGMLQRALVSLVR